MQMQGVWALWQPQSAAVVFAGSARSDRSAPIWIQKKANKSWLWIGLCLRTHEIVAYAVAQMFVSSSRKAYRRLIAVPRRLVTFRGL